MKFAIVMSHFNPEITEGLLRGAKAYFTERGLKENEVSVFDAPGAFETPLIAQKLAQSKRYDGVICLGCVIKGETAHFEFISLGATVGIMQAQLNTGVPISFGILTVYQEEQAQARSRADAENKGLEAARACWLAAQTLQKIQN